MRAESPENQHLIKRQAIAAQPRGSTLVVMLDVFALVRMLPQCHAV